LIFKEGQRLLTPTELWYRENRHFLLLAILQVAVIALLVFVVLPVGDRVLSIWRDSLSPNVVPSETELHSQIAFWEQANNRLSTQLDSAATLGSENDSPEKQLAAIQTAVAANKLSLLSCEMRALTDGEQPTSTAFDLQVRGSFRNLGKLITDLESSSLAAIVDRMSLEGNESGSSVINVSLTLVLPNGKPR
jgi:hypothetical protein